MKSSITVTGSFNTDSSAAECLRCLCKQSISPENIFVSGVNSNYLRAITRRLLTAHPVGKIISRFGPFGAIAGAITALFIIAVSPPWEFLRGFGMFSSFCLGAVLGCMSGTLIGAVVGSALSSCNVREGRLSGNKVVIAAQLLEESPDKQSVAAIMRDCGAADVTVEGAMPALGGRQSPCSGGNKAEREIRSPDR